MSARRWITVDGDEAAAAVGHHVSEVLAPSPTTDECAGPWAREGRLLARPSHALHARPGVA